MSDTRNKEQVYDEEISPLMTQIIEVSKRHGIAMVASFAIPTEDDPQLRCTTHLPAGDGGVVEDFHRAAKIVRNREHFAAFTIISTGNDNA